MRIKTNRALLGAALSLALAPAAASATATVSVRIEGAKKTLLPAKSLHLPAGRVTKSGAGCSANSAAGALDAATQHKWVGRFSQSFGDFSVTGILGESHPFTSSQFWEVLVNDVPSQSGICGTKLRRGDRVLFAAVPITGNAYPLVLHGPATAPVGQTVTVTVKDFVGVHAKPAAGVVVTGRGVKAKSNHRGQVKLRITQTGTLTLHAAGKGYIRSAPLLISERP